MSSLAAGENLLFTLTMKESTGEVHDGDRTIPKPTVVFARFTVAYPAIVSPGMTSAALFRAAPPSLGWKAGRTDV
jgi:hypothetical protein